MKKIAIFILAILIIPNAFGQWINNYWGNNSGDDPILNSRGLAVTTDSENNCYVAGYTMSSFYGSDIILIKYNESGDTIYSRVYSGTGYGEDRAFGIVVDEADNVYLVGQVDMTDLGLQLVVIKYSINGDFKWAATYGGSSLSYNDAGLDIAITDHDKIYVTGYTTGPNGLKDITTLKISPEGSIDWVNKYDGQSILNSEGFGIAVDSDNNIYVTGYITSVNNSTGKDIVAIKYTANGNEKWTYTYNGTGNGDDIAYAIAVGDNDKIYITGYTTVDNQIDNTDIILIKLNKSGNLGWAGTYSEGGGVTSDKAFGIVVDEDNKIYIAGETTNPFQGKNYLILKYNSSGNLIWNIVYNGTGNGDDYANAISLSDNNKVYVTGASWGTNNNFDYVTLRIKTYNGYIQRVLRYSFSGYTNDIAKDITASEDNKIFVTGYSELVVDNSSTQSAVSTMMIKEDDERDDAGENIPESFRLYQNFPNPFNPSTMIKFEINQTQFIKLIIYDVLGKVIDILVNSEIKPGIYSINYTNSSLSSGIYFYELTAGKFRDVKKMSVIK